MSFTFLSFLKQICRHDLTLTLHRTDIEQEVNGVYSYDRKAKIDPTRVKAIFDKAAKMYLDDHSIYTAGFSLSSSDADSESILPTGVAKPS